MCAVVRSLFYLFLAETVSACRSQTSASQIKTGSKKHCLAMCTVVCTNCTVEMVEFWVFPSAVRVYRVLCILPYFELTVFVT